MTGKERKADDVADLADAMVVLGLMLVGAAVWIFWGWAALAFYVGTLLIGAGLVLAVKRGRGVRNE